MFLPGAPNLRESEVLRPLDDRKFSADELYIKIKLMCNFLLDVFKDFLEVGKAELLVQTDHALSPAADVTMLENLKLVRPQGRFADSAVYFYRIGLIRSACGRGLCLNALCFHHEAIEG